MMAGIGSYQQIYYYINESEESDQGNKPLEPIYAPEDLRYTADFRYKRMHEICHSAPLRRRNSKYVQTEPDVLNVPPSWIYKAEKLADDLYTGLGNIINLVNHSSDDYTKKELYLDPNNVKYFAYEKEKLSSKLLRNERVKDSKKIDLHYRNHSSGIPEDITKKLDSLFKIATKLRHTFPYIMGELNFDLQSTVKKNPSCPNCQMKKIVSPYRDLTCFCGARNFAMGLDSDFSDTKSDSGQSSTCSTEYCPDSIPPAKRAKSSFSNFMLESPVVAKHKSRCNHLSPFLSPSRREIQQANLSKKAYSRDFGLNIEKEKPTLAAKQTTSKGFASCSCNHAEVGCGSSYKIQSDRIFASRKGNPGLLDEDNSKNKRTVVRGQQNFIKKNILALRKKPA